MNFIFIKKTLSRIFLLAIVLFGLLVLTLNLLPLATIYFQRHLYVIESFATRVLGQPIKIDSVSIENEGLNPRVHLYRVKLLHDKTSDVISQARELVIDLDILQSVLKFRVEPSSIALFGAHLSLYQSKDGAIRVGKPERDERGSDLNKTKIDVMLEDVIEWFVLREKIHLNDLNIDWFDANERNFNIKLTYLSLLPSQLEKLDQNSQDISHQNQKLSPISFSFAVKIPKNALSFKTKINERSLAAWFKLVFSRPNDITGKAIIFGLQRDSEAQPENNNFKAVLHLKGLNLLYDQDWPVIENLDGDLIIDNSSLNIKAHSGMIRDIKLGDVSAYIQDFDKPILNVTGDVISNLKSGEDFINASPLKDSVGSAIKDLKFSGKAKLSLKLMIPIGEKSSVKNSTKVNGNLKFIADEVSFYDWDLYLKNLDGELNFTESKVDAKNLTAFLFGHKVNIDLNVKNNGIENSLTKLHLKGAFDVKEISRQFAKSLLPYADGTLNYDANLQLYSQNNKEDVFYFYSDLSGVNVSLPLPFRKSSQERKPISLILRFKDEILRKIELNSPRNFNIDMIAKNGRNNSKNNANTFSFNAFFPSLKWDDWSEYFSGQTNTAYPVIDKIKLEIAALDIFGQNLKPVTINISPFWVKKNFDIYVQSPNVQGNLSVGKNAARTFFIGKFSKLHLFPSQKDSSSELNPQDISSLEIESSSFKYDDIDFGALNLKTRPSSSGLDIDILRFESKDFDITSSGSWVKIGGEQKTILQGAFSTNDLGHVLKRWNLGGNLHSGRGKASFDISWPKPFFAPDLKSIEGKVKLKFKNGSIINLGSRTETELGIGRFLNLFSLQSIPRHLTLDFSDITSKGFGFDNFSGDFLFESGNIFTKNANLYGHVANIFLQGRIGLVAKDYDLKLFTTPHITSNLPVLAAVVFSPVVGAATWVADQMIKKKTKNVTHPTYSITGAWKDPVIKKAGSRK